MENSNRRAASTTQRPKKEERKTCRRNVSSGQDSAIWSQSTNHPMNVYNNCTFNYGGGIENASNNNYFGGGTN